MWNYHFTEKKTEAKEAEWISHGNKPRIQVGLFN